MPRITKTFAAYTVFLIGTVVYIGLVLTNPGEAVSVIAHTKFSSREPLLLDITDVAKGRSMTPYRMVDMNGRTVDMIDGGSAAYSLFVASQPPDSNETARCLTQATPCDKINYIVMIEPRFLLRPLWPRQWTVARATGIMRDLAARGYEVSLDRQ